MPIMRPYLTVELEIKLSSVSNKHVSYAVFQTLQRTKTNFEKLLGLQVFKNHNCSRFQSSSFVFAVLFIIPSFTVLSGYLYVSPETHKGLKRATRVNIHFSK